jgi:cycloeucalenol cycloisomerase
MGNSVYADDTAEFRSFSTGRKWLSDNDDRAWAEKFYLWYIPVLFLISGITSRTGLSLMSNWANLAAGLLVWLPYCVILPLILRRNHPLPFWKQWWFKFQLYLAVLIFFLTYFGTEYFFDTLGMRYNYPNISWYFDSALLGADQGTALAEYKRVPIGMYPISVGFFTVYHAGAIVMIRRIFRIGQSLSPTTGRIAFALGVVATALFWAWLETMLFVSQPKGSFAWYEDLDRQLTLGTAFYAMDFMFTFSNVYWLDERASHRAWSLYRVGIEATAMCLLVLLAGDLWSLVFGVPFA